MSQTDLLARSRSHLAPGINLEIRHNPLKENSGSVAAGKEVIVHVQDEDQELVLMEEGVIPR